MYTTLKIRQASILDLEDGQMQAADLYLENGMIREISSNIVIHAQEEIDANGLILTPGLVDAHVHIFHDMPQGFIGLDPDRYHLPSGTTCVIDQGSTGADHYNLFKRHVMMRTAVMCKEVLNCSRTGMYVSSLSGAGELENLKDLNKEMFCRTVSSDPENIVGVKIRLTPNVCPKDAEYALKRAAELARELNLPLVVHPNGADMEDTVLFDTLQAGDVYTHTYHDSLVGILDERRRVKQLAVSARERGVIFDTAHGSNSLSFPVLKDALEQGFEPDTISTDLHNGNYQGPVFDLPTTISKFLCLGMPLHRAMYKAVAAPAAIWKLSTKCIRLEAGQYADLAAFRLDQSGHEYVDAAGNLLRGSYRLLPRFTILGKRVYHR